MPKKSSPAPRSLQEWMERTQTSGDVLIEMVWRRTRRGISPTALSLILRGSRRCSMMNALALHEVTGVPVDTLREWPKVSYAANVSGEGTNHAA